MMDEAVKELGESIAVGIFQQMRTGATVAEICDAYSLTKGQLRRLQMNRLAENAPKDFLVFYEEWKARQDAQPSVPMAGVGE